MEVMASASRRRAAASIRLPRTISTARARGRCSPARPSFILGVLNLGVPKIRQTHQGMKPGAVDAAIITLSRSGVKVMDTTAWSSRLTDLCAGNERISWVSDMANAALCSPPSLKGTASLV